MPTAYQVTVEGNTVTICLEGFAEVGCLGSSLLQREGSDGTLTGVDKCVPAGATNSFLADAGNSPCYVDECVPYDGGVYVAGNHDDSGCAVRSYGAPTGAPLGFNGVVGALGLLLMVRRRRTRA